MWCQQCIKESRIDSSVAHPPLQNPNEHIISPENAMQIAFMPEIPSSSGYEFIVTAMDVFSRYCFTSPTSNQDATTVAKDTFNIMTKHAYIPTTLILDKGSPFVSHVIKEVLASLALLLARGNNARTNDWDLTTQSNKLWRLKQASEDRCGINTSALRS